MGVLGGVHHHHTVLIEQTGIAFHQNSQVCTVLEVEPGATVCQRVGAAGGSDVQRRAHAATAFLIAAALGRIGARQLPVTQLSRVGAALVAARYEVGVARSQLLEGFHDVLALGARGVRLGAHQNEVVVHDRVALDAPAIGHKLFFGHLVVHKEHISVATAGRVQRLAGAQRNHLHIQAAGLLELRQQVREQPRLLGRGGRCHRDGLRRHCARRYKKHSCQRLMDGLQSQINLELTHTSSPLTKRRAASGSGPLKKSCTGKSATSCPCSR